MMIDLVLAVVHHILVFTLFGILIGELVLARPGISTTEIGRLAGLNRAYGIVAVAALAIGIARVFLGLKGWAYYAGNHAFWGKMAVFIGIALISILATRRIVAWSLAARGNPAFTPPAGEIAAVRRIIHAEAGLFVLLLVFAAMMARGMG